MQTRFAAVLARLIAAEQGVWRTGQAGVILGDLTRYASAAYMAEAAKVLRAAQQRWLLTALVTARQMAAKPGFDAAEDGDMLRKVVEDALDGPLGSPGCRHRGGPVPVHAGAAGIPRAARRDPVPVGRAPPPRPVPAPRPVGHRGSPAVARASPWSPRTSPGTPACAGRSPCVLFTLEQDRDEVMDRLLAAEAGVLLEHITGKELDRRGLVPHRRGAGPLRRTPASSSTTRRGSPSRTSGPGCAAWPAAIRPSWRSSTTSS